MKNNRKHIDAQACVLVGTLKYYCNQAKAFDLLQATPSS
jgi:hypothetical protein